MGIYNCDVCGDKFSYQQDVEKHLQLQHDPELPSEEIRMHTELVHQDDNPPLAGHQYDLDEEEDLVSKFQILAYYELVMEELKSTGQMKYFPQCEYIGDGKFISLLDDEIKYRVRDKSSIH